MKSIFRLFPVIMVLLFSFCTKTPVDDNGGSNPSNYNGGGDAGQNGTPSNPSGASTLPSATEVNAAKTLTTQGTGSLETALWNSRDSKGLNIDVTSANSLYKSAIAQNPNNTQAQFGAAVTELLATSQNSGVLEVLDSFDLSGSGLFKSAMLPLDISSGSLKKSQAIVTTLASSPATSFPKLSSLQQIIKDTLLPKIVYALDRLSIIENDPSFKFTITPRMRGLSSGENLTLDNGEIFVIDAGLRVMRSVFLTAIAYNVDVDDNGSYAWLESRDDYTLASNLQRLYNSSTFLALNPWGTAAMQSAIANVRSCVSKLDSSLAFINGRTDDQLNHIIKAGDISNANKNLRSGAGLHSVSQLLDTVTAFVSGPCTITSEGKSVVINISAVFDNPIPDLKAKLPYLKWRKQSQWGSGDSFMPIDFTNAKGTILSDGSIVFPDYTFGGLFPDLTTAAAWDDLTGGIDVYSTSPETPYSAKLAFPFAALLK